MTALEALCNISSTSLVNAGLKYCLVDSMKKPFKLDGTPARPNDVDDFVDIDDILDCDKLESFAGIGISIQASNICAIDVDDCFSSTNDINSADDRAKYFLKHFSKCAYLEFSFSGKGLRILFKHDVIDDYSSKYYIKNTTVSIEYYQPSSSFRYVTLTGHVIHDNMINLITNEVDEFLTKFMIRPLVHRQSVSMIEESRTFDDVMKVVKSRYFKDIVFQNLWFNAAPGSGKDESERDYHLIAYLYENITQDKNMLQRVFESSTFFKTKDSKHMYKWTSNDNRYFNYVFDIVRRQR